MKLHALALLALACSSAARSPYHAGRRDLPALDALYEQAMGPMVEAREEKAGRAAERVTRHFRRAGHTIIPQNKNTTKYAVDGTAIPLVTFDVGESYAGLMPIGSSKTRELYFWFFPTANPAATDEILIWLNGGPGCSSLEGLFQENGRFVWQYGTVKPYRNIWAWTTLTNVVWVEQPVGTGFSQGKPTATNENEVAAEFLAFWKNFVDTFGLQNRKIFISGESYAGYYVPYIADAMLNKKDKVYYGLDSTMIFDPSTSYDVVQTSMQAVPFAEYNMNLFNIDPAMRAQLLAADKSCGFAEFRSKYLRFPPAGHMPAPPSENGHCNLWNTIFNYELNKVNPCFDIYQVATTCPILYDPLGFPGSLFYQAPGGGKVYFNRQDVKKAINAPLNVTWSECANGVLNTDTSPPSGLSVLPSVIERSQRTVIAHGAIDYVLIANGTLMMIQNMTWGGKTGFQKEPGAHFLVPKYQAHLNQLAGNGVFGTTHTERGLTWTNVLLSGHMVPQYQPSAAYRLLEFLLGRVQNITSDTPFTTKPGSY